jgi:FKBP-type peptidyl-prolyl cis-trans isomerase 2
MHDPARVHRVDRARFHADEELTAGRVVWMRLSRGRTRRVRVLEVRGRTVVVDTNHPRSGQSLELEVEVVAILAPHPGAAHRNP